jgi:hypothetical protein
LPSRLAGDAECLGDWYPAHPVRDQLIDDIVDAPVDYAASVGQTAQLSNGVATASTLQNGISRRSTLLEYCLTLPRPSPRTLAHLPSDRRPHGAAIARRHNHERPHERPR